MSLISKIRGKLQANDSQNTDKVDHIRGKTNYVRKPDFEYQNIPTSDGRPFVEFVADLLRKTRNQLTEEQYEQLEESMNYWMTSSDDEDRKVHIGGIQFNIEKYESLEKATPEVLKAIKELGSSDFENLKYLFIPTSDGRPFVEFVADLLRKTRNQLTEEQYEQLEESMNYWMTPGPHEDRKVHIGGIQFNIEKYESLEKATPEVLKAIKELGSSDFENLKYWLTPTSNNKTLVETAYNAVTKIKEHLTEEQYEGLFRVIQSHMDDNNLGEHMEHRTQFYESLEKATPEALKAIKELATKKIDWIDRNMELFLTPTSNNKTLAEIAYSAITKAKKHLTEEQYEVFKSNNINYLNWDWNSNVGSGKKETVDIYEKLEKTNFDSPFVNQICEGFYNRLIKEN